MLSSEEESEIRGNPRVCMEYLPRNYRLSLPVNNWELPFSGKIKDAEMGLMFHMHCHQIRDNVKVVIGEEILSPRARRVIYPSQIVSLFLSNAFDLLQSLPMVTAIAEKVVKEVFLRDNRLLIAVQGYDLWKGEGHIGGLFPRHYLLERCVYVSLYNAIKKTLDQQNTTFLESAFETHLPTVGDELAQKIWGRVNALLVLLNHENESSQNIEHGAPSCSSSSSSHLPG